MLAHTARSAEPTLLRAPEADARWRFVDDELVACRGAGVVTGIRRADAVRRSCEDGGGACGSSLVELLFLGIPSYG